MTTAKPFEFEPALKELEAIAQWFESSDVDLDAGLVKFEHGMELAAQLKTHLTQVENRVEKIKARFASGGAGLAGTGSSHPAASTPPAPRADEPPLESRAPESDTTDQTGLFGA